MRGNETILLIDDDEQFIKTYQRLLGQEGYGVHVATDTQTALEAVEGRRFELVLLDQKLRGPTGPDSGLDLIAEIQKRTPDVKIIIVTAYAAPRAIERAFAAGVYDYLEKNEIFAALLRVKVHNALALAREQHIALDTDTREAELRELWEKARTEDDKNRKGKLLEDVLALLFRTVPGWHVYPRLRNDLEEFDIVIRNESSDPFWSRESPYLLAECKNWSAPVGVPELHSFLHKLQHKYDRCRLGFFITSGRFTKPFLDTLKKEEKDKFLVVAIDGDALERLVQSNDRSHLLKDFCQQATFQASEDPPSDAS